MLYSPNIPRCQYIKVNGTQCGSPAMRRNRYCFFHKRWHEQRIVLNPGLSSPRAPQSKSRKKPVLDLPVLEDANAVQVSLMQVMRLLLAGQIEHKTASLLLYGLQTASANLRQVTFDPVLKEKIVIDPRCVDGTPLGENPWNREDYEQEPEEESLKGDEILELKKEIIKAAPLPEALAARAHA
ncbi:MAG TPA: hypothetical protein VGG46_10575 [Terriglobales bacterium]